MATWSFFFKSNQIISCHWMSTDIDKRMNPKPIFLLVSSLFQTYKEECFHSIDRAWLLLVWWLPVEWNATGWVGASHECFATTFTMYADIDSMRQDWHSDRTPYASIVLVQELHHLSAWKADQVDHHLGAWSTPNGLEWLSRPLKIPPFFQTHTCIHACT